MPRITSSKQKDPLNLRMGEVVIKQLKIHAIRTNMTCSDIVADLVAKHLPDYGITERPQARPKSA